jgi:DNA ligase 1
MKQFAQLITALDQTTKTNEKVDALAQFFSTADEKDKVWTIALLSHRRPRRTVSTTFLRELAAEIAGLPLWLFEDSYHIVGDLAETIAYVLPTPKNSSDKSLSEWIDWIVALQKLEEDEKKEALMSAWDSLKSTERFIFNKLITGGFRMGVSQKLMVKSLAKSTGIEENILAHRLMGNWNPFSISFQELVVENQIQSDISRPYPFYLAYPLEESPSELGKPEDWCAEYKWDGIRGQIICREGELFVWSRGEELITDSFPEFLKMKDEIPSGTVLDGEILAASLSFQDLQTRIGRKTASKALMEKIPVIFMAYDVLEWQGEDVRNLPFEKRRSILESITSIQVSPLVHFQNWEELADIRKNSKEVKSEGMMLKKKSSPYQSGRKKGDWWKWKVDPYTIDAVMIYAQQGHGRRANLFTDFTFAVWDGEQKLVPFTKAYSGLTDAEFKLITSWVRQNTVEKFGPVRSVRPYYVFEIAFEGIQTSTRHKSGVALRFPRILRWRKDKNILDANTLEDLKKLL